MKSVLIFLSSVWNSEVCPPITDNCGPTRGGFPMEATIFSEPNYGGDAQVLKIPDAWGCVDLKTNYKIMSLISSGQTEVTFHYGKGCVGHVLKTIQGGTNMTDVDYRCPGSVFIRYHRGGSCWQAIY